MGEPIHKTTPKTTHFGDSAELSNWLIGLIISGAKTATCSALRDYEAENEALPTVGEKVTVLGFENEPKCKIEILDVSVCQFDEVKEDFALAEGEGDFADWRSGHIEYFERNGGWSNDMKLVCERFELVEVL